MFVIEVELVCTLIYQEFRQAVIRTTLLNCQVIWLLWSLKVHTGLKSEVLSWLQPDLYSNEGLEVRSCASKVP